MSVGGRNLNRTRKFFHEFEEKHGRNGDILSHRGGTLDDKPFRPIDTSRTSFLGASFDFSSPRLLSPR